MADRKLNTGLTDAQILQAFDRALHDLTDEEIRSALETEAGLREQNYRTAMNSITAVEALVIGNYVNMSTFNQLEARVAALEGGGGDD